MIKIPKKYAENVEKIIEWHIRTYMPDYEMNVRLNRVSETLQASEADLYYLDDCVSNAINNISECGVEESSVRDIYHWVRTERRKR